MDQRGMSVISVRAVCRHLCNSSWWSHNSRTKKRKHLTCNMRQKVVSIRHDLFGWGRWGKGSGLNYVGLCQNCIEKHKWSCRKQKSSVLPWWVWTDTVKLWVRLIYGIEQMKRGHHWRSSFALSHLYKGTSKVAKQNRKKTASRGGGLERIMQGLGVSEGKESVNIGRKLHLIGSTKQNNRSHCFPVS